jgi:dihydrofolate reductase
MRKLIAAINMTLDGFCDHDAMIADDETYDHFNELLNSVDTVIYGRITYQLMEYWRTVAENPTGNKPMDEFAIIMDNISKIVFSRTLKNVEWKTARVAKRSIKEEVSELRQSENGGSKDILVGSPSLISALTKLNLIDEYQLVVHPVVSGNGLPLFKDITEKVGLKLLKTKTFSCGTVTLYYEPANECQRKTTNCQQTY